MKRILNMLVVIFVFVFVGIIGVKAIEISAEKEVKAGDIIHIKFTDAKIAVDETGEKADYEFYYDNTDKLEKQSTDGFSGLNNLYFKKTEGEVYFKTKEVDADYTVTFEIKDNNSTIVKNAKVLVKSSKTTTTTTKQTTTVTTTTTSSKSDNAFLKTLEVKANDDSVVELSPSFKKEVYEYEATVNSTIESLIINATMEDSKSKIIYSNNHDKELKAGENNKITLTITSESGKQLVYTLNVKREALTTDATLKDLRIKEVPSFKLKDNKFSYDVSIDKELKELSITYLTNDENSKVDITGNEELKDGSKIKILVTAQDGTKKEYVLNILKEVKQTTIKVIAQDTTNRNPLIIMVLSLIGFTLIGSIIYVVKNK